MKAENKIPALIQARMTSKRLPGKSLMNASGKPLLMWVVEAVRSLDFISEPIVLTSNDSADDLIQEFCTINNIKVFRGDRDNVLLRYQKAVEYFQIERFVRITADNPFYVNDVSVKAFNTFDSSSADYLHIEGLSHIVPEFLTSKAIDYAISRASNNQHLEHVTPILREREAQEKITVVQVLNHDIGLESKIDRYLTVDTKSDFDRFSSVVEKGVPRTKNDLYQMIEQINMK